MVNLTDEEFDALKRMAQEGIAETQRQLVAFPYIGDYAAAREVVALSRQALSKLASFNLVEN